MNVTPRSQAAAEARLPAAAAAVITAEDPSAASSKDMYPISQAAASGVYSLLDFGFVLPEHPEHPDTFIPEFLKVKEKEERERDATGSKSTWTARRSSRSGDGPVVQAVHQPSGGWASGFGTALEDVYRDRGTVSPCFTTKTRCVPLQESQKCCRYRHERPNLSRRTLKEQSFAWLLHAWGGARCCPGVDNIHAAVPLAFSPSKYCIKQFLSLS